MPGVEPLSAFVGTLMTDILRVAGPIYRRICCWKSRVSHSRGQKIRIPSIELFN